MHKIYNLLSLPFRKGRLLWTPDRGDSLRPADMFFSTHLAADFIGADGKKKHYDLGSGLVTNVGVLALANDSLWSVTNAPNNIFRFLKYHASGTGTTAAAATDI